MGNDIATFSRELLHHDPIAPDFVQVELDRCDRFGGVRVESRHSASGTGPSIFRWNDRADREINIGYCCVMALRTCSHWPV